jgi:hypothetical protein
LLQSCCSQTVPACRSCLSMFKSLTRAAWTDACTVLVLLRSLHRDYWRTAPWTAPGSRVFVQCICSRCAKLRSCHDQPGGGLSFHLACLLIRGFGDFMEENPRNLTPGLCFENSWNSRHDGVSSRFALVLVVVVIASLCRSCYGPFGGSYSVVLDSGRRACSAPPPRGAVSRRCARGGGAARSGRPGGGSAAAVLTRLGPTEGRGAHCGLPRLDHACGPPRRQEAPVAC